MNFNVQLDQVVRQTVGFFQTERHARVVSISGCGKLLELRTIDAIRVKNIKIAIARTIANNVRDAATVAKSRAHPHHIMVAPLDIKVVHVGDLIHDQFRGRTSVIDIANQMDVIGSSTQTCAFAIDDLRENPAFAMGVGDEEYTASFIGLLQKALRSARFSFHAFLLFKSMNTLAFSPVDRQAKASASLKLNSVYSRRNRQTHCLSF